jgi:hypothetical protein
LAALLSWPAGAANEPLRLPLFAQLASAFAGLAALVLVLSRAVREVDKRPYVAIAPVLAVFAGLVHAGLRVDLAPLGLSSALVAFGALSVALLGGALIVREEERTRWVGWGLVLAPCAWVLIVVDIAKGETALEPSERAYLAGLFVSTLLMGAAGVAARRLRAGSARANVRSYSDDDLSEAITIVAPAFRPLPERTGFAGLQEQALRVATRTMARAREYWRVGPVRSGAMLFGVALATYLAVGGLRGGSDAPRSGAVSRGAVTPSGPPVIEQLNGGRKSIDSAITIEAPRREHSDKPRAAKTGGSRASEAAFAPPSPPPSRRSAAAASKPTRGARQAAANTQSQVALPAWGNEALRVFGSEKPGTTAPKPTKSTSKPFTASVQTTPVPISKPTPISKPALLVVAKPVVPPKPIEPPKPVEPPKPTKPLTMDQVLDRVESAAKTQRKKAGLAAPKTSKRDAELEQMITGSMKGK